MLFLFRFDLLLHLELYPVVATFHLVVESAGRQIKVPVPRTVRLRASWQRREHCSKKICQAAFGSKNIVQNVDCVLCPKCRDPKVSLITNLEITTKRRSILKYFPHDFTKTTFMVMQARIRSLYVFGK